MLLNISETNKNEELPISVKEHFQEQRGDEHCQE